MMLGLSLSLSSPQVRAAAGSGLAPYTGLVSGPLRFPNTNGPAVCMAKIPQLATDTITALRVAVPNFMTTDANPQETNNAGVMTVAVAIEYPVDPTEATSRQACLWSGAGTGTIAAGALGISDQLTLSTPIPDGATFNVWIYTSNPNGSPFYQALSSTAVKQTGEKFNVGVGNVTVSGTLTNGTGVSQVMAIPAILATTTKKSTIALGDSIAYGLTSGDTPARDEAVNGRVGIVGRGMPTTIAHLNLGGPSYQATTYPADLTARATLLQYSSHFICNLGINDMKNAALGGGSDAAKAAVLASAMTTIAASGNLRAAQKKFCCTITPYTTSTDSWVTTGNQTPVASGSPRVAYNALVRAGISGWDGFFEIADAVESSRDSGLWAASQQTKDGLHPSYAGYATNAASSQWTANLAKLT